MQMQPMTPEEVEQAKVECLIDGHRALHLEAHLRDVHGMTVEQYQKAYPNAPVVSQLVLDVEQQLAPNVNRRKAKAAEELVLSIAGIKLPVWSDVAQSACLPKPNNYRLPRYGKLAQSVAQFIEYVACGRSIWLSGTSGVGKDAIVHAISANLRRPAQIFSIEPDLDLNTWLYEKDFGPDGNGGTMSFYNFGKLWKCLTEGYTTPDGEVKPYIILLSDLDRASKTQIEKLRLILDSIEGRVMGPGDMGAVPVVPGTTIIATANSQGGGDETGRYTSVRQVDMSIINRFERAVIFHPMSWKDEGPIIKSKFPALFEHDPSLHDTIGHVTKALRKAIADDEVFMEFSHRDLCNWCSAAVDRLTLRPNKTANLLQVAAEAVICGLGDNETRTEVRRIMSPYLNNSGGYHGQVDDDEELVEGF